MTFFKQPLPDGGRESSLNYRQTYFGHGDIFLFLLLSPGHVYDQRRYNYKYVSVHVVIGSDHRCCW